MTNPIEMATGILALDLALTTGWALHDFCGDTLIGTWDLRDRCSTRQRLGSDRSPEPAIAIRSQLAECRCSVDSVVFESAYAQPGASTWIQCSLQTAVMLWCIANSKPFSRYRSTEWKKQLLGKGNATRDEYHRAAVLKWPDLDIKTDDEAAALWLLEMEMEARLVQ